MMCDCDFVIEYVTMAKQASIIKMNEADYADHFYYYKGKVQTYDEMLRILRPEEMDD